VLNLSPVQDEQGKNGFRYYAYNPVTEVYSELIRSDIAKQFGWGDWVWWMPHMNEGFVTDNKICAGPVNNAAVVWTAPANGRVLIESRPIWMDQWVNGKGATFSIWHNDTVLAEFRFNGTSYKSDSYMNTISVKAGDRIQIMAARNQLEPWAPQSAQLETNTDLYFTPSN
jgi:hypothetical protein